MKPVTITNEQMTAGAAVLSGYKDLPLNWRNAAIDTFQAMSDAAAPDDGLASATAARDAEQLAAAIDLMKRLKRNLMHARRFAPDTMQSYRGACTEAEGDVEEFLNQYREAMAAPIGSAA